MIFSAIEGIKISGIATAVPSKWTDLNDYNAVMGEEGVEKFRKSTGISGKYQAGPEQSTADFAYAAAKAILEQKNIAPKTIGALIMVTQTPDYTLPATACVLHMRLGLRKDCMAFDVNLGCSGLVYGIHILASLMTSTNIDKGLLLLGDTSGKGQARNTLNPENDAAKMLFGDAGAALLLEKDTSASTIKSTFCSDGSRYKAIINPFGRYRHFDIPNQGTLMDNIGVFNFTIDEVPTQIKAFLEHTNTTQDDYDCLIMHQANGYILKQVGKRAKFPKEKILISIDEYANTSSASIATALTKYYGNETVGKNINALLCGFGVGLSWGTVSVSINTDDILPLILTDEYYDDGFGEEWKNDYK